MALEYHGLGGSLIKCHKDFGVCVDWVWMTHSCHSCWGAMFLGGTEVRLG